MKTLTIGGKRYICPFADLLPALTPDEVATLTEDIRQNGVLVAIIATPEDEIIDGWHRGTIAAGLGIPVPIQVTPFESEAKKREAAWKLNLTRRHLSHQQRRELVAAFLKSNPEVSDRSVAAAVQVDHKTVATTRAKLESTGEIPQLKATKGRDGKTRTAKPARPAAKKPPASPQASPPPSTSEFPKLNSDRSVPHCGTEQPARSSAPPCIAGRSEPPPTAAEVPGRNGLATTQVARCGEFPHAVADLPGCADQPAVEYQPGPDWAAGEALWVVMVKLQSAANRLRGLPVEERTPEALERTWETIMGRLNEWRERFGEEFEPKGNAQERSAEPSF